MEKTHPEFVITLIHGTFFPNASWTQEGSHLCENLARLLGGKENVHFDRSIVWKGSVGTNKFNLNNTHRDRLRGGEIATKRLREITDEFPESKHFIIGHSHGGMVALYGLRDQSLRGKIHGIITMGTPFIACNPRTFQMSLSWIQNCSFMVLVMPLVAMLTGIVLYQLDRHQMPGFESIVLLVSLCVINGLLMIGISEAGRFAELRRDKLIADLTLPSSEIPLLCLSVPGDEARASLQLAGKLAKSPFRFWSESTETRLIIILFCVYWPLVSFWMVQTHRYESSIGRGDNSFLSYAIELIMSILFAIVADFFTVLFSGIILLLLMFFANLVNIPAFGSERIVDNLLTNIEVSLTPQNSGAEYKLMELVGPGTPHGRFYQENSEAFTTMAEWIKSKSNN